MASKTPTFQIFVQQVVQADVKEIIKGLNHWTFVGKSTDDRWIPIKRVNNEVRVSMSRRHHVKKRRQLP